MHVLRMCKGVCFPVGCGFLFEASCCSVPKIVPWRLAINYAHVHTVINVCMEND